ARVGLAWMQIGHGLAAALKERALEGGGQETAVEAIEPARWYHAAAEHEEAGQVTARAAQAISNPCSHAGPTLLAVARVDEVIGVGVLGKSRNHRTDDAQVVDLAGDVGEQVADRQPALAVTAKSPG